MFFLSVAVPPKGDSKVFCIFILRNPAGPKFLIDSTYQRIARGGMLSSLLFPAPTDRLNHKSLKVPEEAEAIGYVIGGFNFLPLSDAFYGRLRFLNSIFMIKPGQAFFFFRFPLVVFDFQQSSITCWPLIAYEGSFGYRHPRAQACRSCAEHVRLVFKLVIPPSHHP